MKLRHLISVAAATFGLALAAQAAPAGPTPGGPALAWTHNGVTLAGGGHTSSGGGGGGGGGGHYSGGGGYSGQHIYSGGGSYSGKHIYNGSGSYSGKNIYSGGGSYSGKHIYSGSGKTTAAMDATAPMALTAVTMAGAITGGIGAAAAGAYYGYGTDESCFAECLTSGYSPAYCTANSWQFCW